MIGIAIALGCGAARATDDSATDDTDSNTSVPSAFTLYRLTVDHCHLPMKPEFPDEEACVRRLFGSEAFDRGALHVAWPVEARPVNLRLALMNRNEADTTQAGVSDLCFVETGKGKAKRRTPYILDFDGQCRAADPAVHHKKKLRKHTGK
jgi:hypothetical protein